MVKKIRKKRQVKSQKPKIIDIKTPGPALTPRQQAVAEAMGKQYESDIVKRLKSIKPCDVIVTNTEPEALIFITPTLRKMKDEYGNEITLHITPPQNKTFIELVSDLDTVKNVEVHNQIDQALVEKLEKKNGNVIMLNYLAALQQTLARGLHASQGIAALTQIVLNQFEALELEVSLAQAAKDAAKQIYGEGYVLLCPEFIAAIDPNYVIPRLWDRNKWLELAGSITENLDKEVIILSFLNGNEPVLPQGIYDKIVSITSQDAEETTAIISNAAVVVGVDAGFVQIARALNKSILQIHSGGPASWSASIYPKGDVRDGTTRILAAIDINVITVEDVRRSLVELLQEKPADVDDKATEEVRSCPASEVSTEGSEDSTEVGDQPGD